MKKHPIETSNLSQIDKNKILQHLLFKGRIIKLSFLRKLL